MENLFKKNLKIIIYYIIMFKANGNYVLKEHFDENSDIDLRNSQHYKENSHLFYDAAGVLRSTITANHYGDLTFATNYGSTKHNMVVKSDGSIRSTGNRLCLDDVCLTQDDILKLKQIKLDETNKSDSAGAQLAEKQEVLNEANKEDAINKLLQQKTDEETNLNRARKEKEEIEGIINESNILLENVDAEIVNSTSVKEQLLNEINESETKIELENNKLQNALLLEDQTESENINNIILTLQQRLETLRSDIPRADKAIEDANIKKDTILSEISSRESRLEEVNKLIITLEGNLLETTKSLDLLTNISN